LWSQDDQDKAIAWQQFQRLTCQNCGTRLEEWEEDSVAYITSTVRCPGCEAIAVEQDNIEQQVKESAGSSTKGVRVVLIPRWVHEQQEAER
jgi:metal-sulfur cluster biosynthetic enzyme